MMVLGLGTIFLPVAIIMFLVGVRSGQLAVNCNVGGTLGDSGCVARIVMDDEFKTVLSVTPYYADGTMNVGIIAVRGDDAMSSMVLDYRYAYDSKDKLIVDMARVILVQVFARGSLIRESNVIQKF